MELPAAPESQSHNERESEPAPTLVARVTAPMAAPCRPWVLMRLSWYLFRNYLRLELTRAHLRTLLFLAIAITLWFSLAALTRSAFDLLTNLVVPGYMLIQLSQLLLGAVAVALAGILAFTAGLTCYLELFRAPDVAFWFCSPMSADRIFRFKWFRTLLPGLWILTLLVLPVLWQWHTCFRAAWWSYGVLVLALGGLLVLSACFGCLVCLIFVWLFPSQGRRLFLLLAVLLLLLGVWYVSAVLPRANFWQDQSRWLRQVVRHLDPLQWFLTPSHWWSAALTHAATGQFRPALFATALLWSNALMLYLVTAWFASRTYRSCYTRVASLSDNRRSRAAHWLFPRLAWPLSWPSRSSRALLRKDLLTLCRDPVQWSQLGVLAAVLILYFCLVGQLGHQTLPVYLRRLLQFVNLVVVALAIATWASRFVYPLVAQEIRAFWLLNLVPLRRGYVLYAKWIFSSLIGIAGAILMIVLSLWMLSIDAGAVLLDITAAVVLGLSLPGISVGLAGLFVEPHELSPTQPLTSYGNTLTLLLCIGFGLFVAGLAGLPVFLDFQLIPATDLVQPHQQDRELPTIRDWLLCTIQVMTGVAVTAFFLYLGQRRLHRLEF
ncbi:MAG: hypothetical protein RMI91_05615 [Gemmatales bacterium]|nr:hypothetical protein [Gemmatales bacterium]MDW7994112.1 hypothetical protein [Gemmatales bacterium]